MGQIIASHKLFTLNKSVAHLLAAVCKLVWGNSDSQNEKQINKINTGVLSPFYPDFTGIQNIAVFATCFSGYLTKVI